MLEELYFHMIIYQQETLKYTPHHSPLADLTIRQHSFGNKQMKSFSLIRRAGK